MWISVTQGWDFQVFFFFLLDPNLVGIMNTFCIQKQVTQVLNLHISDGSLDDKGWTNMLKN